MVQITAEEMIGAGKLLKQFRVWWRWRWWHWIRDG
jgi:hypothetical protein